MGRETTLRSARRKFRRALLFSLAAAIAVAACDPGTRIEGDVTLGSGLSAPDDERHTLYIAAFTSAALVNGVLNTAASPVWFEFAGVANEDFDPDVYYALGGAGAAQELFVFAWWKVDRPQLSDYEPVAPGDLFGRHPDVVFPGEDGSDGAASKDVDIVLDRVFVSGSSASFAP